MYIYESSVFIYVVTTTKKNLQHKQSLSYEFSKICNLK